MKSVHLPFRQVNQNYKRKPFKRLWKSTYDLRVQKIYENSWETKIVSCITLVTEIWCYV